MPRLSGAQGSAASKKRPYKSAMQGTQAKTVRVTAAQARLAGRKRQGQAEKAYAKWSRGGTSARGRKSRHQEY